MGTTPTNIHLPLSWCKTPRSNPNTSGHRRTGLYRILLPTVSRRILTRRHRKCTQPFLPPRHPVKRQGKKFTHPHRETIHLCHRLLHHTPLHNPAGRCKMGFHRTWQNWEPNSMWNGVHKTTDGTLMTPWRQWVNPNGSDSLQEKMVKYTQCRYHQDPLRGDKNCCPPDRFQT